MGSCACGDIFKRRKAAKKVHKSKDLKKINNLTNEAKTKDTGSQDLNKDNNLSNKNEINPQQKNNDLISKETNNILSDKAKTKSKLEDNNLTNENISQNKEEINNLSNKIEKKLNQEETDLQSESSSNNKIEIHNLKVHLFPKEKNILDDKNENNNLPNQYINYKTYPKGTKYEEELNLNFKYFNVFWYDTNKTNDYNNFKKCFENVQFYKGKDLYSTINFFKKESISEWIVITSGSLGEELILNLENFKCINSFFVYCRNVEYHKEWTSKKKKLDV